MVGNSTKILCGEKGNILACLVFCSFASPNLWKLSVVNFFPLKCSNLLIWDIKENSLVGTSMISFPGWHSTAPRREPIQTREVFWVLQFLGISDQGGILEEEKLKIGLKWSSRGSGITGHISSRSTKIWWGISLAVVETSEWITFFYSSLMHFRICLK